MVKQDESRPNNHKWGLERRIKLKDKAVALFSRITAREYSSEDDYGPLNFGKGLGRELPPDVFLLWAVLPPGNDETNNRVSKVLSQV
jgi:hypothetical protein